MTVSSTLKNLRALVPVIALALLTMGLSACASETETETMEPEADAQQMEDPAGASGDAMGGQQASVQGTIDALQGDVTAMNPATAVQNLNSWQTQLENANSPALSDIASNIEELKGMLQGGNIDGQAVGQLLTEMGNQTTSAASNAQGQMASQLEQLGSRLSEIGNNLTGGGM